MQRSVYFGGKRVGRKTWEETRGRTGEGGTECWERTVGGMGGWERKDNKITQGGNVVYLRKEQRNEGRLRTEGRKD